ncbi:retron St85 family RNA-directed DNA polymerase [Photobacterium sp. MCCC 1A19761]|uniref:retron St85 family RNA-directed DNA polymerase n=1 Tax=Photobacterium sp. MCCC 1A19761 TaxID=3115000 RepID=UPI00307EA6FE
MKILLEISDYTGKDIEEVISDYLTAPRKYKEFKIRKRSGGFRNIAQPSNDVKIYQYAIIEIILNNLLIHDSATAYRDGRSIYHNALPHKDSAWILKLDFKNFFHSIRPEHLKSFLSETNKGISSIEIDILNHYLFWMDKADRKLKLSIGAPSSPIVSNIIMYNFDESVCDICSKYNVIYTRYADDLTLSASSKKCLLEAEKELKLLVEETQAPLLVLNEKKRVLIGGNKSKRVTGVVITHENQLSVGRYKRKKIRAMLHLYKNSKLNDKDIPFLHGTLSYIKSIEENYYISLRDKYGDAIFKKLARESFNISKLKYKEKEERAEMKNMDKDDWDDIVF